MRKLLITKVKNDETGVWVNYGRVFSEEGKICTFFTFYGKFYLPKKDFDFPFLVVEVSQKIYDMVTMKDKTLEQSKFAEAQLKLVIKKKLEDG